MTQDRFAALLEAYLDGALNDAEARELLEAIKSSPEWMGALLDEIGTAQVLAQLKRREPSRLAPAVMAALRGDSQKIALRDSVMARLETRDVPPVRRKKTSRAIVRAARRQPDLFPLWALGAVASLLVVVGLAYALKRRPDDGLSSSKPAQEISAPAPKVDPRLELMRMRLAEAERRHQALEADLAAIQKQQESIAAALETPKASSEPKVAEPDAERARVLIELETRRQAATRDLELAERQRREAATQLAKVEKPEAQPESIAHGEKKPLGKIAFATADAYIVRDGKSSSAVLHRPFFAGDRIETTGTADRRCRIALAFMDGSSVDLAEESVFLAIDGRTAELQRGLLYASVEKDTSAEYKPGEYKWLIRTPNASAGVTGTRFDLGVEGNDTRIRMEEGSVAFFNKHGRQTITEFQSSHARAAARPATPEFAAPDTIWRGRSQTLPPLSVVAFALADCDTAKAVKGYERITGRAELSLSAVATRNFTLVARTLPERIGSVRFTVNGSNRQVESVFPYCISTDTDGNAKPWDFKPGVYEIVGTPYSGARATGSAGQPLKIILRVTE